MLYEVKDFNEVMSILKQELSYEFVYEGYPEFVYHHQNIDIYADGTVDIHGEEELIVCLLESCCCLNINEGTFTFEILKDGRKIRNLICMIASKGELINKIVGVEHLLFVEPALIKKLYVKKQLSYEEVCVILDGFKLHGFEIRKGVVLFYVDHLSGEEKEAVNELLEVMVSFCMKSNWITPKRRNLQNEKYAFRVWVNAMGMRGERYKKTRKILMKRLSGNPGYRTEEKQRAAIFAKKIKQWKKEEENDRHYYL